MKKLLFVLTVLGVVSCHNKGLECSEDYKGCVIAEKYDGNEYLLKDDCTFKIVHFADFEQFQLGDTIGKKKFSCSEYWVKRYEELENKYIELNKIK